MRPARPSPSLDSPPSLTGWFVRRAGVARITTFLCAAGLAASALVGARPLVAVTGLGSALFALVVGLGMRAAAPREGGRAQTLVLIAVLLSGLFAGYLGGSVRVLALSEGALVEHAGARVQAELVVTGEVRVTAGRERATARVMRAHLWAGEQQAAEQTEVGLPGESILLEVKSPRADPASTGDEAAAPVLSQGAVVSCVGFIREPSGPTASGFDQRAFLRRQGVEMVLQAAARDVHLQGSRGGFWGFFDRVRSRAQKDLSRGPEARLDEVFQGVVMGDTQGIDSSWLAAFRRAGTAHMLSVSGLHVGCVAAIMLGVARLLRLPRGGAFGLAALASVLMIPFTGPSPPVMRAAAMIVVVLTGRWLGRGRDRWQILALAAVVVLGLNPLGLFDVGFQLSFSAFTGILALTGPLERCLHRLPSGISSNVAVSAAASLGTAPVSLFAFDQTPLVGVAANLLVVPALPVITCLGLASVFSGYLWAGLSALLDTFAAPVLAWTVLVSRLFAAAPVLREDDLGRALAGVGVALFVLPAALAVAGRQARLPDAIVPAFYRRSLRRLRARSPKKGSIRAALAVGLLGLALLTGTVLYEPGIHTVRAARAALAGTGWPTLVEVRVLDVGQGNAVLVRTPGRHSLLFDGGAAGCGLGRQLLALGVRSLDVVVISHPHADHFAGLLECLDDIEVGVLLDGVQVEAPSEAPQLGSRVGSGEACDYLELRRRLAEAGTRHVPASTGSLLEVDGVEVSFFTPRRPLVMHDGPDPWGSRAPPGGEELNGSSVVALLRNGEAEFLLPGDAEAAVLERYALPPVDVLIVPHHGSGGGVSTRLLQQLRLKAAAITVGEGNPFGHPHPDTLALLQERVPSVVRTDLGGWVCYSIDGGDLALDVERGVAR